MRLLLAPHAETDWNAQGRFQGHADTSLNERGRRQARILQQHLAGEPLHAIVASDLRRAVETAEIVAAPHGLCVQTDPRLRELNFGDWEGLTYAEIQERDAKTLADWENDPLQKSPPGGEHLTGLAQRLQEFLDSLDWFVLGGRGSCRAGDAGSAGASPSPNARFETVDRAAESILLLVAHRGSLRVLLCLLLGRPVERHWEFHLDPATTSEVNIAAGRAELLRLNEIPLVCEVGHGR